MKRWLALAAVAATISSFTAVPANAEADPRAERVQQCRAEWQTLKTSDGGSFTSPGDCAKYVGQGGVFSAVSPNVVASFSELFDCWEGSGLLCYNVDVTATNLVPSSYLWLYAEIAGYTSYSKQVLIDETGAYSGTMTTFFCSDNWDDSSIYAAGTAMKEGDPDGEYVESERLSPPC